MSDITLAPGAAPMKKPGLLKQALSKPGFMTGVGIIGFSTLLALFPGLFAPYDPNQIDYVAVRQTPSWEHIFGTDLLGRDTFSRVIWAYSVDMRMAFLPPSSPLSSASSSGRWSAITAVSRISFSAASSMRSSPFRFWFW